MVLDEGDVANEEDVGFKDEVEINVEVVNFGGDEIDEEDMMFDEADLDDEEDMTVDEDFGLRPHADESLIALILCQLPL